MENGGGSSSAPLHKALRNNELRKAFVFDIRLRFENIVASATNCTYWVIVADAPTDHDPARRHRKPVVSK